MLRQRPPLRQDPAGLNFRMAASAATNGAQLDGWGGWGPVMCGGVSPGFQKKLCEYFKLRWWSMDSECVIPAEFETSNKGERKKQQVGRDHWSGLRWYPVQYFVDSKKQCSGKERRLLTLLSLTSVTFPSGIDYFVYIYTIYIYIHNYNMYIYIYE